MESNNREHKIAEKIKNLNTVPKNIGWTPDLGWANYKKKYITGKIIKRITIFSTAVAAISLLCIFLLIPEGNSHTIKKSTSDEIQEIVLNDGSRIWLNKNSTLKINQKKNTIRLKGEIYAELSGLNEYVIISPHTRLNATNGHFNLKSREEKKRATLTVEEGAIEALWDHDRKLTTSITEGIQAEIIPETALVQAPLKDPNYLAWKTGELEFQNTPLYTVLKKLEELNDIKIHIENSDIRYCKINEKFSSTNPEQILNSLSGNIPYKTEKKGENYFIEKKNNK